MVCANVGDGRVAGCSLGHGGHHVLRWDKGVPHAPGHDNAMRSSTCFLCAVCKRHSSGLHSARSLANQAAPALETELSITLQAHVLRLRRQDLALHLCCNGHSVQSRSTKPPCEGQSVAPTRPTSPDPSPTHANLYSLGGVLDAIVHVRPRQLLPALSDVVGLVKKSAALKQVHQHSHSTNAEVVLPTSTRDGHDPTTTWIALLRALPKP